MEAVTKKDFKRGFTSEEARARASFERMLRKSTEQLGEKKRDLDKRLGRQLGGGRQR